MEFMAYDYNFTVMKLLKITENYSSYEITL